MKNQHPTTHRIGFLAYGVISYVLFLGIFLFSNFAMVLLFWMWQPMGGTIWDTQNQVAVVALNCVCAGGWLLVLVSTFLINHFDLFGLRQVWLYFRVEEYTHLKFTTPSLYKHVRHPLYVGWFIAFWATPTMTVAHLVFAIATAAYILIAIQLEERALVQRGGSKW